MPPQKTVRKQEDIGLEMVEGDRWQSQQKAKEGRQVMKSIPPHKRIPSFLYNL